MLINSISADNKTDVENVENDNSVVVGHLLHKSQADITVDGYVTSLSSVPEIGQTINLSIYGLSLNSYDGGTYSRVLITNITYDKTNTDYLAISMQCIYHPNVDYDTAITPTPPEPTPTPVAATEYYIYGFNRYDIISRQIVPTTIQYTSSVHDVDIEVLKNAYGTDQGWNILNILKPSSGSYSGDVNISLPFNTSFQSNLITYKSLGSGSSMLLNFNINAPLATSITNLFAYDNDDNVNKDYALSITIIGDNIKIATETFKNMTRLQIIDMDYSNLITAPGMFDGCTSLSADAISDIINALPTYTSGTHEINFLGNPSFDSVLQDRLLAKGWQIK